MKDNAEPKANFRTLEEVVTEFVSNTYNLVHAFTTTREAIQASSKESIEKFGNWFVNEHGIAGLKQLISVLEGKEKGAVFPENARGDNEGKKVRSIKFQVDTNEINALDAVRRLGVAFGAPKLIFNSLFTTLVSIYDAYLAALIKSAYPFKKDALSLHSKQVPFGEFVNFGSIAELEEFLVDREIEEIMYKGRLAQIKWFSDAYSMNIKIEGKLWSDFVEITERRNCIVHNGSRASRKYVEAVKGAGSGGSEKIDVGHSLDITQSHFEHSYSIMVSIGIILGHVLWCKLDRENVDRAWEYYVHLTFDYIRREDYHTAQILLEMALNTLSRKDLSDASHKSLVVNMAQCYKWQGEEAKMHELLSKIDWSGAAEQFNLAVAVLNDNFDVAVPHLRNCVLSNKITEDMVLQWPVFKKFRESAQFTKNRSRIFPKKAKKANQSPRSGEEKAVEAPEKDPLN